MEGFITDPSSMHLTETLASDVECKKEGISGLKDRTERYSKAKEKALGIAEYIKNNFDHQKKLAINIADCGSYLLFRHYYQIDKVTLHQASFCKKHLLCPLCAIRRGAKQLSQYLDRFKAIRAERPDLEPYMVNFTVVDGPDLKERFNHLRNSLQKYHKQRHRKNTPSETQKFEAAVWSYEIKRGENSGLWHPHVHAIWMCSTPPSQQKISEQWRKLTGDSFIVDVRKMSDYQYEQSLVQGFLEVFKYAVKFSDQPLKDTWHCYETLSGRRLIGSAGLFYGIQEDEQLTDSEFDLEPYVELFFRFIGGSYVQREKSAVTYDNSDYQK